MDNREITEIIYKSLDMHKADNIRVIDISNVSIMADYFVIASAGNINHVHALCDYLEDDMRKAGLHYSHIEGYDAANWILMDYGDIVVHIFDASSRDFYDLEHVWRDGSMIEMA
ncbi:MAG: ribosome silencing factor [Lachnospiraceae bacterium]|nr:ribosome silencing factor [Lachnospiraceae bacterium]